MDQSYFASVMAVVLTRAAERMLLVLVGALAIYLGYSLFLRMPNAAKGRQDGEGKIELPGGVSIFLTRVGPGIFFALVGIAGIGYFGDAAGQSRFPTANDRGFRCRAAFFGHHRERRRAKSSAIGRDRWTRGKNRRRQAQWHLPKIAEPIEHGRS